MTRQQVPNAELGTDTARLNLLTNGGFEIWQRGVGPSTGNGTFLADRWINNLGGPTSHSVSRIASTIGSTGYSQQVVYTHGSGGYGQYLQSLAEQIPNLQGKTVTFSIHVKSPVVGGANVVLLVSGANAATKFNQLTNVDETISVTTTLPAAITGSSLAVEVVLTTSGTYEFNDAMLVVGSVAADYAPLHPADDLARCLRYYEVINPSGGTAFQRSFWAGLAGGNYIEPLRYQRKAVVPTLTKVGTWTVVNCSQPTFSVPDVDICAMLTNAPAVGQANFYASAGGSLLVEANP